MLRANGLVKRYGRRAAVDGVTVHAERGEIVGLLGPNGAGKTTTFYMILGLVRCDAGEVWLDDHDITRLPVHRRSALGIGYLAQEPSIFRGLTVEENILGVLERNGMRRAEQLETTDRLLDTFGLQGLRKQAGAALSGGERRRVEVARVLALKPSHLLLDEPFTGVDPKAVAEIQEIILNLRGQGIGVILTDHNVRDALSITDRAIIIYEGRALLSGTRQKIVASDEVRRFFLGDRFRL